MLNPSMRLKLSSSESVKCNWVKKGLQLRNLTAMCLHFTFQDSRRDDSKHFLNHAHSSLRYKYLKGGFKILLHVVM